MEIQDKDFSGTSVGKIAVDDLKDIMLQRMAEQEKTRRLLIIITAVLVVFAACIMVFGPESRQGTSTIIGVVLLVFALGSIGASQFVIKAGGWEVSTKEKNAQKRIDTAGRVEGDESRTTKPGYTSAE